LAAANIQREGTPASARYSASGDKRRLSAELLRPKRSFWEAGEFGFRERVNGFDGYRLEGMTVNTLEPQWRGESIWRCRRGRFQRARPASPAEPVWIASAALDCT